MNSANKLNKIPNLTPIRFILAFLVVISHVAKFSKNRGFPFFDDLAIFHKGTEAVYMFFSLSGFLIIKQLLIEKKSTNTIDLKGFYKRRVLRIFPLYYLVLAFGFLYYHLVLPYFGFDFENNYNLLAGLLLSITFFPNIFSTYSPGGILEILWSIGIEEQFYLLVAPLFLLLPLKRIILFLSLFTGVYFLMYFSEGLPFLKKYNMLFFYFSFGGLCAILLDYEFTKNLFKTIRIPVLVLFIIYYTSSVFVENFTMVYYHLFSFVLFGFALSALSLKPIKILQNDLMNHLGKISYGIYMYHAIVLQLTGLAYLKIISKLDFYYVVDIIILNLSVILLTIIVSHLSYKYYESYFLKLKRKSSN